MAGASGFGDTVSTWLEAEGIVDDGKGAAGIADVPRVRGLLIEAARAGHSLSYTELLAALGHGFTRPKMRALCKTLFAIDLANRAAGEPELAVLVVRESDRLPGQGWWMNRADALEWKGEAARLYVDRQQAVVFDYWATE